MMRSVGRTGGEIHVERLVGRKRMLPVDPTDRLIGHVHREMVVRGLLMLDARHSVENRRRPLVGFATNEAVELVEPGTRRPAIHGTGG